MKKKIMIVIITILIMMTITGCSNLENKPSLSELAKINDPIIQYFQSDNVEYDNYSFNYVDERAKKVVVGLLDNTKEQQDRFKELVIDSEYLVFIKADLLYDEVNSSGSNNITLN